MKISSIDIRQIRVFIAVARSGGFSAAQDFLGLAQSTISTEIASLETRLGCKLCSRGRAGFELTPQGEAVMKEAESLLNAVSDFETKVTQRARLGLGTVRLAVIDNVIGDPNCPLVGALDRFVHRTEGRAHLAIDIAGPEEVEEGVRAGKIDVGVGIFRGRDANLAYRALYAKDDVLVCGKRHPLFEVENDLTLFARIRDAEKVVRKFLLLDDLLFLSDRRETVTAEIDNIEAAAMLILAGHHIGFLPLYYAEQWVQSGEMRVLMPGTYTRRTQVSLVHRSNLAKVNSLTRILIEDIMGEMQEKAVNPGKSSLPSAVAQRQPGTAPASSQCATSTPVAR